MVHVSTIHANDEHGQQATFREVEHEGETFEFRVDLGAVDDPEDDGHEYVGEDRGEVPDEVEQALAEHGAGASGGGGA